MTEREEQGRAGLLPRWWQTSHSLIHSFLQLAFPEFHHLLGTVLGAVDLKVNKADGVPVLLELVRLEEKADKQANGLKERILQSVIMRLTCDEKDLGGKGLISRTGGQGCPCAPGTSRKSGWLEKCE